MSVKVVPTESWVHIMPNQSTLRVSAVCQISFFAPRSRIGLVSAMVSYPTFGPAASDLPSSYSRHPIIVA